MSNTRDKIALILAGGQIVHKQSEPGTSPIPLEKELPFPHMAELLEKIFVVDWSRQPVCHYTLRMCSDLIQIAGSQIQDGAKGVVITCGIQALTEVAYFASLVWSYPQPLIFTASVNYADSAGSETELLLSQAISAAGSQACWGQGVGVCVQDAVYAGSELFHFSNYTRFGYMAPPCGPIAQFYEPYGDLAFLRSPRRGKVLNIGVMPARNVEIVDVSLGGGDIVLNALLDGRAKDLDGLVLSAFGGGDIPPSWVPLIRKMMRQDIPVALASRCPQGRVQQGLDFEGSASRLLEMGLINAGHRTPLQARIRLAVALGAEMADGELRSYMQEE